MPFPPFVEVTPQGKNHSNETSYVVTFTYDHFSFSFGIVSKSIIFALTSYIPQWHSGQVRLTKVPKYIFFVHNQNCSSFVVSFFKFYFWTLQDLLYLFLAMKPGSFVCLSTPKVQKSIFDIVS